MRSVLIRTGIGARQAPRCECAILPVRSAHAVRPATGNPRKARSRATRTRDGPVPRSRTSSKRCRASPEAQPVRHQQAFAWERRQSRHDPGGLTLPERASRSDPMGRRGERSSGPQAPRPPRFCRGHARSSPPSNARTPGNFNRKSRDRRRHTGGSRASARHGWVTYPHRACDGSKRRGGRYPQSKTEAETLRRFCLSSPRRTCSVGGRSL